MTEDHSQKLWRFARGDLEASVFEPWCYEAGGLEPILGKDLYLRVIATDFADSACVDALREQLVAFLCRITDEPCQCHTLSNTSVVDMGEHEHVFATLIESAERGQSHWWLSLYECEACGQAWLVGSEERQNDVFCLRRLSANQAHGIKEQGLWPPDFDLYETLLRIGSEAGRSVRFIDPLGDSSLAWTIRDLAQARPGISLSEITTLLNIDLATGRALLQQLNPEDRERIRD